MKKMVLLAFVLVLLSIAVAVRFVRPAVAEGTIYIKADGSVVGTTYITSTDNVTYYLTDNINDEIVVERDNIIVDGNGYTLQGNGTANSKGFSLSGRNNVTIRNTTIKNFTYGIYLVASSNNSISGNNITNNGDGIFLNFADNNLISNNTCEYNGLHDIQKHGIELWNSDNNLISNNTCSSNYARGISLSHSDHNTISNNICENNYYHGIHLDYSSNNTISNNTCEHNSWGINLNYSSNNTISNNIANNNLGYDGICLWENCNNNTLTNNTCENNAYNGINLYSSSNNMVSGNNANNNTCGIGLDDSNNNSIYHNNFIDNTNQVYNHESNNTWDDGYPSGGNYWSDYTGVDLFSGPNQNETGSDGIGDTPYIIDGNNQGNYPLMNPWGAPPPPSYTLTIYSSPSGVTFTVDGVSRTTPWSAIYSEGASLSLVMPETHDGYVWSYWLEDGDINRTKTVTLNTNVTLTGVFTLDTTPPTISIVSPENKTYDTTDIPLTFTVDETVSWIAYSLDGQANVTITGNTTLPELSDGSHSLIVYAKDTDGNTGASEIIYFTIETEKEEEAFPTWIIAPIVIIAVVGAALLVYFTKIKKTTEKVK